LSGEGSNYVDSVLNMALDMLRLAAEDEVMRQHKVAFHVGIATGPVMAGVIGAKRFTYDVWGDTVNIANRITAEASPNVIVVDKTTYLRLNERYRFESGMDVVLNGKKRMTIYQLLAKQDPADRASGTIERN
jgi:adenylate cyclase